MRSPVRLAAIAIVSLVVATACTSSPDATPMVTGTPGDSSAAPTASESTGAPSTSAAPRIPDGASPLTGLPIDRPRPVLVVKVANTGAARPHAGLTEADIVYVEPVEWGLNRLAAVFSSQLPDRIGPVRSARITDIELLAQYGRPALAFSGAQGRLLPFIAKAPLYDVSGLRDGYGYIRDSSRPAPNDYFVDPEKMLERAPKATDARDIGFAFGDAPSSGGSPATRATAEWDDSSVGFRWDGASGTYRVWFDGDPARAVEDADGLRASTVVIQYVEETDSGFGDRYGGKTPMASTVGSGSALVLRDGQVWTVDWSRPDEASGTSFTLPDGSPMPFKPGQQWVVLFDRTKEAVVR